MSFKYKRLLLNWFWANKLSFSWTFYLHQLEANPLSQCNFMKISFRSTMMWKAITVLFSSLSHQGNTALAFSALKFLIKNDCLIGHELRHVIHGNLLLLGWNKDFDMIKGNVLPCQQDPTNAQITQWTSTYSTTKF